jgi:DNA helicase-4
MGAMTRFSEQFGPTRRVLLDRTFRFDDRIAQVSRKFILRNSAQIDKTLTPIRYSSAPSVVLNLATPGSPRLNSSLEEINEFAEEGASVLILERYRHHLPPPAELKLLAKQFPRLRFTAMSIHAAKGLESDYVLVGLRGGYWGFPSQLVDDALLELVLNQADAYPHGEERRLFYVAITRARFRAYLLADTGKEMSVFTQELLLEYTGEVEILGNPRFRACTQCHRGLLKPREGSGGRLLTCTNTPACKHSLPVCPECRQGILERDLSGRWLCPACSALHPVCPRCASGVLQPRQGPFSTFLGCSNYAVADIGCRYKQHVN